ncbi:MAG: hypothetical protein IT373_17715, partial [Polyangiaceae bacterium]|nr:hypothetical protein [Polyangiaceae bacterium]
MSSRAIAGVLVALACAHCGSDDEPTVATPSSSVGGSSAGGGGAGGATGGGGAGPSGGAGGAGGTSVPGLDPNFHGGLVTAGLGWSFDEMRAAARQPDGKVVAVGSTGFDVSDPQAASEALAIRFGADGTLDTSFGSGGHALVAAHARAFASAVAIQPDGKIVIVGGAQEWNGNVVSSQRTLVARLTPDGALDSTFGGGDGVVLEEAALWGTGLALQPDGKIVVASANQSIFRYDASGTPDASFGTAGVAKLPAGAAPYRTNVGIAADGGILAANEQITGSWTLTRLGPGGSVDTTYGTSGSFTVAGFSTRRESVRPDGSVVLCGTHLNAATVMRVDAGGALDTAFGAGDGMTDLDLPAGFDTFLMLAVDEAERILASNADANSVARFLANGTLDASFGTAGVATPAAGFTDWEVPLVALAGGAAIVVGMRGDAATNAGPMGAVRLDANGVLDAGFAGGAGLLLHASHTAPDAAIRSHVAANGTIVTVGVTNGFPGVRRPTLARHLQDGSLDASFGDGGWARTALTNLRDSTMLGDDSLVVAGATFTLEKRAPNGALDTSYGVAGTANLAAALGGNASVARIARDGSDRVLAVGAGAAGEFLVARVGTDGALDTTFDGDGVVALAIAATGGFTAVTSASSGAVLAAGAANGGADVVVVRLLPDGTPDAAWGTAGQAIVGPYFEARAIAEQPGDKWLVAGYRTVPNELAIVRLDGTGAVDATFGTGGWIQLSIAEAPLSFNREQRGPGLAVLPDGAFFV